MPTDSRRAAARRRAWGRGPIILRFEPLESRALLSGTTTATTSATATALPDLVGTAFQTVSTSVDWGASFDAKGTVLNQGNAPANAPFQVDIFASPTPTLSQGATLLGQVTIPAGLAAGTSSSFNQPVTLPPAPIGNVGTNGSLYVGMLIDPTNQVAESNKFNNADTGLGFDLSLIKIAPAPVASLVGTSISVSPNTTQWGGTLNVTEQVTNNGAANAPATRALIMLTPSGVAPGGSSDFAVGYINVPAIAAGQTIQVSSSVALPQAPPPTLAASTAFTLSVVQDADFQTNQIAPHLATQGLGLDQATVDISTPSFGAMAASTSLPDLIVANVMTPTTTMKWGQSFQVNATVENAGTGNVGEFRVRFLLVGTDGSTTNSLFLGDTLLSGLAAGYAQNITQTLQLPARLPDGQTLNSLGTARIAVVADPENAIAESTHSDNVGLSNPITLKVISADGSTTVPASPTAIPAATTTPAATPTAAVSPTRSTSSLARTLPSRRLAARYAPPRTFSHDLKVFPGEVSRYFKNIFKKL